MSVLRVGSFAAAAQNVAATTLRSVVGDMPLDDVLSKREEMNASLRVRLDEVTERWGVKVTTVEVREVNPPPGVLDAMTRQMSAERTRRAAVTEAEGPEAGRHHARGRHQTGRDPRSRRGTTERDIACRRSVSRFGADPHGRSWPRLQHDAAPVPRDAEAGRLVAVNQARRAHGARRAPERAAEHAAGGPGAIPRVRVARAIRPQRTRRRSRESAPTSARPLPDPKKSRQRSKASGGSDSVELSVVHRLP